MNYDEIEKQYQKERKLLADQYPFPGIHDNTKLLKWFETVSFLSTSAQAYIAGISDSIIREKKKELGLLKPKKITRKKKKKRQILQVPKNWRNKEVLTELAKDYTPTEISRAAHICSGNVSYLFWKYGIKYGRQHKKKHHPCKNFKWCYHYYIVMNYSMTQCAQLANVSYVMFRSWLLELNIPIKKATPNYRQYRPWVDALKKNLSNVEVVDSIIVNEKCITIRYKNHIPKFYPSIESYYFNDIEEDKAWTMKYKRIVTANDCIYNSMAPLVYEYGNVQNLGFDNPHPAMIKMSRKDFNSKTFIEKRVSINNMMYRIISRGWMNPSYPIELLEEEFDYLKNINLSVHTVNGILKAAPTNIKLLKKCKQIPFNFFDLSRLWRIMRKPRKLRSVINKLADGVEDITYTAILKAILYESGLKIPVPTLYSAIFKKLNVRSVLDMSPGYGSKAIACAILGIKYIPRKTHAIEHAMSNGFAEFVNLDYEWFDENIHKKYDLMVGTDIFSVGLSAIKKYKHFAKNIIAFVRKDSKEEFEARYKPTSIVPIIIRVNGEIDYLFIW